MEQPIGSYASLGSNELFKQTYDYGSFKKVFPLLSRLTGKLNEMKCPGEIQFLLRIQRQKSFITSPFY